MNTNVEQNSKKSDDKDEEGKITQDQKQNSNNLAEKQDISNLNTEQQKDVFDTPGQPQEECKDKEAESISDESIAKKYSQGQSNLNQKLLNSRQESQKFKKTYYFHLGCLILVLLGCAFLRYNQNYFFTVQPGENSSFHITTLENRVLPSTRLDENKKNYHEDSMEYMKNPKFNTSILQKHKHEILDTMEKKGMMSAFLRKYYMDNNDPEFIEFRDTLSIKDMLAYFSSQMASREQARFGLKIIQNNHPIPLVFHSITGGGELIFNKDLASQALFYNKKPLMTVISSQNYTLENSFEFSTEFLGIHQLNYFSNEVEYYGFNSIDLYVNLPTAEPSRFIMALTQNFNRSLPQFMRKLETVANFSAIILYHVTTSDILNSEFFSDPVLTMLANPKIPNRGYVLFIHLQTQKINALLIQEFERKLKEILKYSYYGLQTWTSIKKNPKSREFEGTKFFNNFTNITNHFLKPNFNLHTFTEIEKFYENPEISSISNMPIIDERMVEFNTTLNKFASSKDLRDALSTTSANTQSIFQELFPFADNLRQQTLVQSKLNHYLQESKQQFSQIPDIAEKVSNAESNLNQLKNERYFLKIHDITLKMTEALTSNDELESLAVRWALNEWIAGASDQVKYYLRNDDRSDPRRLKFLLEKESDYDISSSSIIQEVLIANNQSYFSKILDKLKQKFLDHEPIQLLDDNMNFGNLGVKDLFENLYIELKKDCLKRIGDDLSLWYFIQIPENRYIFDKLQHESGIRSLSHLNQIPEKIKFRNFVLENLDFNRIMKFYVISVIGDQSVGKSTLLNILFRLNFNIHADRCTKGIYGVTKLYNEDLNIYIIVLDSEGLNSGNTNKGNLYNSQLALELFSVSNIVMMCYTGQANVRINEMLELTAYALKELGMNQTQPVILWAQQQTRNTDGKISNEEFIRIQQQSLTDSIEKVFGNSTSRINFDSRNFFIFPPLFIKKTSVFINCSDIDEDYLSQAERMNQRVLEILSNSQNYYYRLSEFYDAAKQNWEQIISFSSDLLSIKSVIARSLRDQATSIFNQIISEVRKKFEESEKFENLTSWMDEAQNNEFYANLSDIKMKSWFEVQEKIDLQIFNQSKFAPIHDLMKDFLLKANYSIEERSSDVKRRYQLYIGEIKNIYQWDSSPFKSLNLKLSKEENIRILQEEFDANLIKEKRNFEKEISKAVYDKFYITYYSMSRTNPDIINTGYLTIPGYLINLNGTAPRLDYIREHWIKCRIIRCYDNALTVKKAFEEFIKNITTQIKEFSDQQVVQMFQAFFSHIYSFKSKAYLNFLVDAEPSVEYKQEVIQELMRVMIEKEIQIFSEKKTKERKKIQGIVDNEFRLKKLSEDSYQQGIRLSEEFFAGLISKVIIDAKNVMETELEKALQQQYPSYKEFTQSAYQNYITSKKSSLDEVIEMTQFLVNPNQKLIENFLELGLKISEPYKLHMTNRVKLTILEKCREVQSFIEVFLENECFKIIKEIRKSVQSLTNYFVAQNAKDSNVIALQARILKTPLKNKDQESIIDLLLNYLDALKAEFPKQSAYYQTYINNFAEFKQITTTKFYQKMKQFGSLNSLTYPTSENQIKDLQEFVTSFKEKFQSLTHENIINRSSEMQSITNLLLDKKVLDVIQKKNGTYTGCQHTCPICKKKCDLPFGHEGPHSTEHWIASFGGSSAVHSHDVILHTCHDCEVLKKNWGLSSWTNDQFKPILYFLRDLYPDWVEHFPKEKHCEQPLLHFEIQKKVWVMVGEFLSELYTMKHQCPAEWQILVPSNMRLPRRTNIPNYVELKEGKLVKISSDPFDRRWKEISDKERKLKRQGWNSIFNDSN